LFLNESDIQQHHTTHRKSHYLHPRHAPPKRGVQKIPMNKWDSHVLVTAKFIGTVIFSGNGVGAAPVTAKFIWRHYCLEAPNKLELYFLAGTYLSGQKLMARITLTIEDDNGQVISAEQFRYDLDLHDGRFSTLEGEVDRFKKQASQEITAFMLAMLQKEFLEKKNTKAGGSTVRTK
jgi:hypothetical protein